MIAAPRPEGEAQRLQTLRSLDLLDTAAEERFDRIARLARRMFNTPIALFSLVDEDRQWFKSSYGMEASETPRDHSFCGHAILQDDVFLVEDASEDERFRDNPLVTDSPDIRFYAGAPIKAPDGSALGTLCVIGREPRQLEKDDAVLLRDLADIVEEQFAAVAHATMDEVTGITNRRGFETISGHTLSLCRRVGRAATLAYIDLDDFKQINRELGREEGDRILGEFGAYLLRVFRDSDVVARWGEDEFCVLLTDATEEGADRPLEMLRERVASLQVGSPIEFSFGAAHFDSYKHQNVADLVEEARVQMMLSRNAKPAGSR